MSHASGQPQHRRISSRAWRVVLLGWCVVVCGCGAKKAAEAGGVVADVDGDVWADVAGDAEDAADVDVVDGVTDTVTDVAADAEGAADVDVVDGVTDAVQVDDGPDVDVVEVDIPIVDATPAVDTAVPCSATEIPAALTGTVEFEAAAYISNPVVMGCGKGAPKSVKVGTPCCDCPPPYSCYCNGECGWLRAPDLVKPQHDGQAVWTGKWVVSFGEAYGKYQKPFSNEVMPGDMNLQRWQPGSGKGFELVPLPSPEFPAGHAVLYVLGEKVVVAVRYYASMEVAYTPSNSIYLYDPDANIFTKVPMPVCGKLLLSGATLVCVAAGKSNKPDSSPGLHVFAANTAKWTLVQPPADLVPKEWFINNPDNTVADGDAVYLVRLVRSELPWPDGTKEYPGPGHILKYELKSQQWSDIGLVPEALQSAAGWYVRARDHLGIVLLKESIQAARFRLDTFKWEVGPKTTYDEGGMDPVLSPCGLVFGDGTWWGGSESGGMKYRPILLAADLSWKLLSPWGYPNDAVTSRKGPNTVITDKELFALGGFNGPPDGNFVYHKDSYRYPLAALCPGGKP